MMKPKLIDSFGRVIDYLRVSITDLCNLRCVYCLPPEGVRLVPHEEVLRYEEFIRILTVAVRMGVKKIRLTGGEPLVRRGVADFVRRVNEIEGIEDLGLTTNGTLLTDLALPLRKAGLRRVNVSLDSLRRDVFARITGKDRLDDVLKGIEAARAAGLAPIKLNVVLLGGINDADIPEFARLTRDDELDVRFIERMPVGPERPDSGETKFTAGQALETIVTEVGELEPVQGLPLDGPATMYRLKGARGRIGVIDPVTGHFCAECNRLRLTARGAFRPCLMGVREVDIKSALRRGASDEELAGVIRSAVNAKPGGSRSNHGRVGAAMHLIGG
jgi:cyclic pyranopterin phosphate synthase